MTIEVDKNDERPHALKARIAALEILVGDIRKAQHSHLTEGEAKVYGNAETSEEN